MHETDTEKAGEVVFLLVTRGAAGNSCEGLLWLVQDLD